MPQGVVHADLVLDRRWRRLGLAALAEGHDKVDTVLHGE